MGTDDDSKALLSALVAGPIAGVCSRFFIYPVDTIKARLQVQGSLQGQGQARTTYTGVWDAVKQISRHEGLRGFYKGFGAVVVGNIPANVAYFGGYELGKAIMPAGWGLLSDMGVGAVAQLMGGLLFTPVDIIKERMQVQAMMTPGHGVQYATSWHALKHLATNAVWIPWSMLHIAFYEQSKRMCSAWWWTSHATINMSKGLSKADMTGTSSVADDPDVPSDTQGDLPSWVLGVCSAASASAASLLTHPMDVVKTRLQVLSTTGSPGEGLTVRQVALTALRKEGPKVRGERNGHNQGQREAPCQVFMAGAWARVLTLAPGSALSWMVYEPVKRTIQDVL